MRSPRQRVGSKNPGIHRATSHISSFGRLVTRPHDMRLYKSVISQSAFHGSVPRPCLSESDSIAIHFEINSRVVRVPDGAKQFREYQENFLLHNVRALLLHEFKHDLHGSLTAFDFKFQIINHVGWDEGQ